MESLDGHTVKFVLKQLQVSMISSIVATASVTLPDKGIFFSWWKDLVDTEVQPCSISWGEFYCFIKSMLEEHGQRCQCTNSGCCRCCFEREPVHVAISQLAENSMVHYSGPILNGIGRYNSVEISLFYVFNYLIILINCFEIYKPEICMLFSWAADYFFVL